MVNSDSRDSAPTFEALNLIAFWRVLAKRAGLIFSICLVATLGAIGGAFMLEPIYRADVLLASAEASNRGSSLGGLLGEYGSLTSLAGIDISSGAERSLDESIEILRSRAFTERFIAERGVLSILFADGWDESAEQWRADGQESGLAPTSWDAFKRFDSIRKIAKDSRTGFVKLSIEWADPEVAARWANEIVALLNEHLRARAVEEAERSIGYLQTQLDLTSVVERRQMLIGLMENETRKVVLAKARVEYAVRVLDPAVSPEDKVRPRRGIIAVAAMLVGLLMGILLSLFLESSKRGV